MSTRAWTWPSLLCLWIIHRRLGQYFTLHIRGWLFIRQWAIREDRIYLRQRLKQMVWASRNGTIWNLSSSAIMWKLSFNWIHQLFIIGWMNSPDIGNSVINVVGSITEPRKKQSQLLFIMTWKKIQFIHNTKSNFISLYKILLLKAINSNSNRIIVNLNCN